MSRRRLLVAALLLGLIAAFFALDLGQYHRLEYLRAQQSAIEEFRRANPLAAAGIFFAIYVAVTGLSVPGAAVLSLVVGAIFGLLGGTLIVSFASSIGATLAFLSSRFLFRESVRSRFGDRLRAVEAFKARWRLARWPKPARFDRNLVVIGAGSAGLVSAYIAAAVKAKVTLIEKDKMGGDCLNTGCVPSKALIKSARLVAQAKRPREFGFRAMQVDFDFADVMERVQRVVRTVEPHDSAER